MMWEGMEVFNLDLPAQPVKRSQRTVFDLLLHVKHLLYLLC